jgi:hypothetical protein
LINNGKLQRLGRCPMRHCHYCSTAAIYKYNLEKLLYVYKNQEGKVPIVRHDDDIFVRVTYDTTYTTAHKFPDAQKARHNRIKCKMDIIINSNLRLLSTDTKTGTQTCAGWYSK